MNNGEDYVGRTLISKKEAKGAPCLQMIWWASHVIDAQWISKQKKLSIDLFTNSKEELWNYNKMKEKRKEHQLKDINFKNMLRHQGRP